MLTKKLKKIERECRKVDDPVFLRLAAYVDHVGNYLGRAKDDGAAVKEYGDALARLDLSAVVKAHEAFAATGSATEQEVGTPLVESPDEVETKAAKKAKQKEGKKEKKAEEAQAMAVPANSQETGDPGETPTGSSSKQGKKAKKNKRKGAKKKGK